MTQKQINTSKSTKFPRPGAPTTEQNYDTIALHYAKAGGPVAVLAITAGPAEVKY